jgi:hypothetical protein
MWVLLRVCVACPTPRLNLMFKLFPSWNNIHDMFPTGTTQDTTHFHSYVKDWYCIQEQMVLTLTKTILKFHTKDKL